MKLTRRSLIVVASAAVSVLGLPTYLWATAGTAATVTATQPANRVVPQIDSIHQAPDPSAVIDAYARGMAIDPENMALREAFLQRMIDFGLPGMAASQARDLLNHDRQNGLAWGVLAYVRAASGQLTGAITDVSSAVKLLPNNEFVQRTAGQLVAWYDAVADASKAPETLKLGVQELRKELADKPAFKETYQEALAYYQSQKAQTPAQAQVPPPSAPPSGTEVYTIAPPPATPYGAYDDSVPTDSYAYAPYSAWPDYYPAYGGDYFWPVTPDYCIGAGFIPFAPYYGEFYGGGIFGFGHRFHDRDDFALGRHGGFLFNGRRGPNGFTGFNRFNAFNRLNGANRGGFAFSQNRRGGLGSVNGFNRFNGLNHGGFTFSRPGLSGTALGGNRVLGAIPNRTVPGRSFGGPFGSIPPHSLGLRRSGLIGGASAFRSYRAPSFNRSFGVGRSAARPSFSRSFGAGRSMAPSFHSFGGMGHSFGGMGHSFGGMGHSFGGMGHGGFGGMGHGGGHR